MRNLFMAFILVLSLVFMTGGITMNATPRVPYTEDEVANILYNQYPQLYQYYVEGVMKVKAIRPVYCNDGSVVYEVDYELITYYYTDWSEKLAVLKEYFSRLYYRYLNGSITIGSVYKYVDTETGDVRYHATYRENYTNRYYDYCPIHVRPTVPKPHPVQPREHYYQHMPGPRPGGARPVPHHRGNPRPPQQGNRPGPAPTPHSNPGYHYNPPRPSNSGPSHHSGGPRPGGHSGPSHGGRR